MANLTRWRDLQRLARAAERRFGLRRARLEPMAHPRVRKYGDCDVNGVIRLRVHRLHRPNTPLAWRTVLATLAHELAHCHREGWDHGPRHRELTAQIEAFLRGVP